MKSIWNGALLMALVLGAGFATLSCKDDSNPVAPPAGADVTIDIVADAGSSAFGANPVTVTVNQKVAWRNTRQMQHTATSDAAGVFNTGLINPGATSAAITMTTAGTYPYHCSVPGHTMSGSLIVNP
jgi:plastocyanin